MLISRPLRSLGPASEYLQVESLLTSKTSSKSMIQLKANAKQSNGMKSDKAMKQEVRQNFIKNKQVDK